MNVGGTVGKVRILLISFSLIIVVTEKYFLGLTGLDARVDPSPPSDRRQDLPEDHVDLSCREWTWGHCLGSVLTLFSVFLTKCPVPTTSSLLPP